jgi:hypothetical protein
MEDLNFKNLEKVQILMALAVVAYVFSLLNGLISLNLLVMGFAKLFAICCPQEIVKILDHFEVKFVHQCILFGTFLKEIPKMHNRCVVFLQGNWRVLTGQALDFLEKLIVVSAKLRRLFGIAVSVIILEKSCGNLPLLVPQVPLFGKD